MMRLFRRQKNEILYPPHQLVSAASANKRGEPHVALELVREARDRFDEFYGSDLRSRAIAEMRADGEEGLALAALERHAAAEPLLSSATKALDEPSRGGTTEPHFVAYLIALAFTRLRLNQPDESLSATTRALELLNRVDLTDSRMCNAAAC